MRRTRRRFRTTTVALVRIATLIALDAPPASYGRQVAIALEAGASAEDILGVLRAVAPQVGTARVVAAAPELMLALGMTLPGARKTCLGRRLHDRAGAARFLRASAIRGGAYFRASLDQTRQPAPATAGERRGRAPAGRRRTVLRTLG